MNPARRKQLLYIGAGALVLVVLYRWYASRSGGAAAPSQAQADGTAGADYSQLAGQETSDAAALANQEQSDMAQLHATESGDIADVSNQIAALTSAEQGDVGGIASQYGGLSDQIDSLTTEVAGLDPSGKVIANLTHRINQLASGQTKQSRRLSALGKAKRTAKHQKHATKRTATARKHASGGHTAHHGHQSTHKHAGSGAVAPSSHERKPGVTAKPRNAPQSAPVTKLGLHPDILFAPNGSPEARRLATIFSHPAPPAHHPSAPAPRHSAPAKPPKRRKR